MKWKFTAQLAQEIAEVLSLKNYTYKSKLSTSRSKTDIT